MTTQQLIERFRKLTSYDLDPFVGLEGTDEEVVGLLNEAMVEIAVAAYLVDPAVSLTVTPGTGSYSLEGSAFGWRIVEPISVVAGGRRLQSAVGTGWSDQAPGLWTIGELNRFYPTWPTDAAGQVARAVWAGDRLILHPAPAGVVNVTVEAQILPPALSADELDAEPELPVRLHPAIAMRAVYNGCLINAQSSDQFSRLQTQVSEAMGLAMDIGRRNRASRFGSPTVWDGTQPTYFSL